MFLNAFSSSSWTAPATASLFTGQYPVRHGVTRGFHAAKERVREVEREGHSVLTLNRMPRTTATLPERLRSRGYATFGLATNPNIGHEIGFDRGFDRFERLKTNSAELVFDRLLEWESTIKERTPYFIYVHLNDTHPPYVPRQPWYRPTGNPRDDVRAAYDSEIRYVDGVLEKLVGRFDPDDNGVLVVLSDHGEEFWEHGALGHFFSLHAEVNRILFLVRAPTLGVSPRVVSANVSIVDVLPTLLELVAGEPTKAGAGGGLDEALEGRSLIELLTARDRASASGRELAQRPLFAHREHRLTPDRQLWAVIRGRWKLIEEGQSQQLFDLKADPAERWIFNKHHPHVVAGLSQELERFRMRAAAEQREFGGLSVDRERLEELRILGYVEDGDRAE